jgi:hypothetical protein
VNGLCFQSSGFRQPLRRPSSRRTEEALYLLGTQYHQNRVHQRGLAHTRPSGDDYYAIRHSALMRRCEVISRVNLVKNDDFGGAGGCGWRDSLISYGYCFRPAIRSCSALILCFGFQPEGNMRRRMIEFALLAGLVSIVTAADSAQAQTLKDQLIGTWVGSVGGD